MNGTTNKVTLNRSNFSQNSMRAIIFEYFSKSTQALFLCGVMLYCLPVCAQTNSPIKDTTIETTKLDSNKDPGETNQDFDLVGTFTRTMQLGKEQENLGRYEEAIRLYGKASQLVPVSPLPHRRRGALHSKLKLFNLAVADFTKALQLEPQDALSLIRRGLAYENLGQLDNALIDCNKAIEEDPADAFFYWTRGNIRVKLKDYDQALKDYDKAIDQEPNNSEPHRLKGALYELLQENLKALDEYSKAISLDPNDYLLYWSRGEVYANLSIPTNGKELNLYLKTVKNGQHYDRAISDYSQAIKLVPDKKIKSQLYVERSHCFNGRQNYSQAISDCTESISLTPNYEWAYYSRGLHYDCNNSPQKALEDFSKAISLKPNDSRALVQRGNIYFHRLKVFGQALADYERAISLDPSGHWGARACLKKGSVFRKQGQQYKAIAEFNKAEKLRPTDKYITRMAQFSKSKAYCDLGLHDKAIRELKRSLDMTSTEMTASLYYEQAIKEHPQKAWPYQGRGNAKFKLGQLQGAIEDCTLAVSLEPKFAQAYLTRGLAYKKLQQFQKANDDFAKAVKLDPKLAKGVALDQ